MSDSINPFMDDDCTPIYANTASASGSPSLEELRRLCADMRPARDRMLRFRDELERRGICWESVMEAFEASEGGAK